jgi:hypothetical protein
MLRYNIDAAFDGSITGWAFDEAGQVDIEAWIDGRQVGKALRLDRPDVAQVNQGAPLRSGFQLAYRPQPRLCSDIELRFVPGGQCATVTVVETSYARYLRAVWSHFQFVRDYFPPRNETSISAHDAGAMPNTPAEMLAIANHLFVLRRMGLSGDFAEFGCFKGYSTSMLSYACELLGLRMHVFDSFAGLPASDSDYYAAGEFRGDIEEVQRNVATFGSPAAVTYHKGFFADTLKSFDCPPLISLWLDVDLAASARDVMTVFRRVDPRGAVFSHECDAEIFIDGIRQQPGPHSVVPPILEAYRMAGAAAEGIHLAGQTGAFWRRDGIAVMPQDRLMALQARY